MSFLKEVYNRNLFLQFLSDRFLPEDFREDIRKIELSRNHKFTTEVFRLGECKSLELEVFEIHHSSVHDARVGIAKDAFQLLLHHSYCNRALVAFIPELGNQWRFSLLQMDAELSPTNRITHSYSNARRYSFLLGEGALIKTPTQFLMDKGRVRQRTEGNKTLNPLQDLQHRFSIEALTQDFYGKLYNWYLWAVDKDSNLYFPKHLDPSQDKVENKQIKIIRLITRMLFVWFIKQKHLVPDNLFDNEFISDVLKNFDPTSKENGNYYNAILQNLFFATLNQEIEGRTLFTTARGKSSYYGNKQLYRDTDKSYFTFPIEERKQRIVNLFKDIPYLNGGLFECLDQYEAEEQEDGSEKLKQITNFDGFSHQPSKRAIIPNAFFFAEEHPETVTVKEATENTPAEKQVVSVMGLIELFKQYNFTVEENTTSDKVVSLDPELLGRVFENLLAAYNPETQESARKSTGSFYTPREIVEYMVEEALIAYLSGERANDEAMMRQLVKEENIPHIDNPQKIIDDLKKIKILDPACGSGAFPMGILLKITDIIEKLTPKDKFNRYETKLEIIKNCIYGIDIQAIAMLICKLRFFISLICDCEKDSIKPNYGIVPLPNLETKFVAANSLLPAKVKEFNEDWTQDEHLKQLQRELLDLRVGIFDKRTHKAKLNNKIADRKKCREIAAYIKQNATKPDEMKIERLQNLIAQYESELPLYAEDIWVEEAVTQSLFGEATKIKRNINKEKRERLQTLIKNCKEDIRKEQTKSAIPGFEQAVEEVTQWNPYNQNSVSPFFDAEWMFGIGFNSPSKQGGFDVVIGNPPYISVRTKNFDTALKPTYKALYKLAVGQYDLYTLFIELSDKILKGNGILAFIIPTRMLSNENFMAARLFVMEKMPIIHYVNAQKPFESANVEANIMVCKKGAKEPIISSEILNNDTNRFMHVADIPFSSITHMPFNIFPFVFNQDKLDILFRIQSNKNIKPLSEYLEITRGFECGYNDSRIGIGDYKFIMSESIFGYCVIQDKPMYCNPDFSKTSKYKTKETFCTVPKLLTKFCSNQIKFALDRVGYCNTNSVYNCALKPTATKDLLYLLGILNSSLTTFWFNTAFLNIDTIFPHIQKNQLEAIPIIQTDNGTKESIVKLVKSIFELKNENLSTDISSIEQKIDEIVFAMYGISQEERMLIEQG